MLMIVLQLYRNMQPILPNFYVSLALRTVKITKVFSKSAYAPPHSVIDTANTNYHFVCSCESDYIGRCKRRLNKRIRTHMKYQSEGDHIFMHIYSCPSFQSKKRKTLIAAKSSQLKPIQVFELKLDNF